MNLAIKKSTCRVLVASMLALSFQMANAGLIGADRAADPATDRTVVMSTLDRADVVAQLQNFGVDAQAARERIRAMSDQEVHALAQDIQAAPAGADSGWAILAVLVIAGLVWYYMIRT